MYTFCKPNVHACRHTYCVLCDKLILSIKIRIKEPAFTLPRFITKVGRLHKKKLLSLKLLTTMHCYSTNVDSTERHKHVCLHFKHSIFMIRDNTDSILGFLVLTSVAGTRWGILLITERLSLLVEEQGLWGPNWSYTDSFHPSIWTTLRCDASDLWASVPSPHCWLFLLFISKHLSLRIYFLNSITLLSSFSLSGLYLLGNLFFFMSKKVKANTRLQSGMFDQKFLCVLKFPSVSHAIVKSKISHLACGVDLDGNDTFSTCETYSQEREQKIWIKISF